MLCSQWGSSSGDVRVRHSLEMKPWIRSWGPDCEVLVPVELRREIAGDMIEAVEMYGGSFTGI